MTANIRRVREKGKKAKKGRKKTAPKKPGRKPTKLRGAQIETAKRLAKKGATNEQISAGLDIAPATFYRLMQWDPELRKQIKEAKDEADDAVEVALYARALGYETNEDTYELTKIGMMLTKRVPKHMPPDPKAGAIWLYNRRRNDWKQRQIFEDPDGKPLAPVFVVPAFNNAVQQPSSASAPKSDGRK